MGVLYLQHSFRGKKAFLEVNDWQFNSIEAIGLMELIPIHCRFCCCCIGWDSIQGLTSIPSELGFMCYNLYELPGVFEGVFCRPLTPKPLEHVLKKGASTTWKPSSFQETNIFPTQNISQFAGVCWVPEHPERFRAALVELSPGL